VVATVRGVISPRWFHHPVARLWKKPEQRQKVAEIFQVAGQLVRSKRLPLVPAVVFSPPLVFPEASAARIPAGSLLAALIQVAGAQLTGGAQLTADAQLAASAQE
jgi:hypothetical protein